MSDEKQCESPTTGPGPIVMYYVNNGIYGDFNTAVTDPGCFVPLHLKVCLYVLNATFNNISVLSCRSVSLVEETGGPGENHRPVAID